MRLPFFGTRAAARGCGLQTWQEATRAKASFNAQQSLVICHESVGFSNLLWR